MTDIKKKPDLTVIEGGKEVEEKIEPEIPPFNVRMAQLGGMIRAEAKNFLKFDSEVSNIDYVYVDTQQYKDLVGKCCDTLAIGFECMAQDPSLQIERDGKGVMVFVATVSLIGRFFDPFTNDVRACTAVGMGVSRGSGYAFGVAQTNAMRNLLTNTFFIPTSDRESDDVKQNFSPSKYLTEDAKSEKRAELLEKTKSNSVYSTVQYGKIVYAKIQETLKKEIPEKFRETLEGFVNNKFDADGNPIPVEDDTSLWIVKKTAANKILSDLDEYE